MDWRVATELKVGPNRELPPGLDRIDTKRFPYQEEAVRSLAEWWKGDAKAGVLCLPTGAGKTRTAVDFLLEQVVDRRVRILWLTHRVELMNQAISTFAGRSHVTHMDFWVGCYGRKDERRTSQIVHVLVGSIPTLVKAGNLEKAWKRQGGFHLVVVDECHHAPAPTWTKLLQGLLDRCESPKVLGLSATPMRQSEKERVQLWQIFESPIYEASPRGLIDEGYLAKPEVVPLVTGQCFKATAEDARAYVDSGELRNSLIKRIAEDELRNEFAANAIVSNGSDWGRTLIFTATKTQARSLRERLAESGVQAAVLTGETPSKRRHAVVSEFRAGRPRVLINVKILTEGTDLPCVDTVVLARPTRSQVLFQQMVGRGMRGPKVGGTMGCRIVVLQDEIQGLVEHQLTYDYGWEVAQLRELGLLEMELECADENAESRHENLEDADDRKVVETVIRQLREVYQLLKLHIPESGSPLVGWWELDGQPVKTRGVSRPRVLPHFRHDEALHEGLKGLAEAISNGGRLFKIAPSSNCVTRLTCQEFWNRAVRPRTAPTYCVVGSSDERTADLGVDLLATAAEEASGESRQAAEDRLKRLIAQSQSRWRAALVKRVQAAAAEGAVKPARDPDSNVGLSQYLERSGKDDDELYSVIGDEPMPEELVRLYCAAEALLGPHWVRVTLKEHAARLARKVFATSLQAGIARVR